MPYVGISVNQKIADKIIRAAELNKIHPKDLLEMYLNYCLINHNKVVGFEAKCNSQIGLYLSKKDKTVND